MRFFCFSFLLLSTIMHFSCTSRPVEPTRSSRHVIDSLYQQKTVLLKPEIDSICEGLYKNVFTVAVDSIMVARKTEMNILVE